MRFVDFTVQSTKEEYLNTVRDNRAVNAGVRFGEDGAYPTAEIKERKHHLRIRCRMVGGATRDNGFLFGTYFWGTLRQRGSASRLRGVIVTEPIIHLIWLAVVLYFIIKCIQLGGFSAVPIFLSLLMFFMFKPEYKKQGILWRYLARAASRTRHTESEKEMS